MLGEENYSSLASKGERRGNSCWDTNSRFLLRFSIHGLVAFMLTVMLIEVVLYSVLYHRTDDMMPISISPYSDEEYLIPCVFPRINENYEGAVECVVGGSFCPENWECSIVADQETTDETLVCLNYQKTCGDLHYCTNYISGLSPSDTTIPGRDASVGIKESFYITSMVFMSFGIFLLISMWIVFNFWAFMIQDESPESLENVKIQYLKLMPSSISPVIQILINVGIILPLGICLLLSGIIYLTGSTTPLESLTQIEEADCFVDHWLYLFSATILGWITAFFVTLMLCIVTLWALLSLYNIQQLFDGLWDPRIFITVMVLVNIVVACGIAIELTDVTIAALS